MTAIVCVLKRETQGLKVPSPLSQHGLKSKIRCRMAALTLALTQEQLCFPVCPCICPGMWKFKAGDAQGAAASLPFVYCQGGQQSLRKTSGHPLSRIKDACPQHRAMSSPGHPMTHRLCLPCTTGTGSLDLAGLGVLEDLSRRLGGVSGGSWQALLRGWGLLGRVEVGKLLCTAGEGAPRSRGAGGTRRWSGTAARKGEKWSEVLGYQVLGWGQADPESPLYPTRE